MIDGRRAPALTRRRLLTGLGLGGAALTACGPAEEPRLPPPPEGPFQHGVASGDPLADRVILWTRVSVDDESASGPEVAYEVALDRGFEQVVTTGAAPALASSDRTVKVDVAGLAPGTEYYYRFSLGETRSPIGRAKTLPVGPTAEFKLAVFSCANYPFGYFNVYRHFANAEPVDAALHLGDYFYEYGPDGYGAETGDELSRAHSPARETVTLDHYRARHAQYKSDPDLQAAHAAAPFITIWDDHESANNATPTGAENHDPDEGEGEWSARKAAAIRAYFEWMPIREPEPNRPRSAIWRSFEIGDLATLTMLETRLTVRSPEIFPSELPIPADAADGDAAVQAAVDAFLAERVGDPARELLGAAQLQTIAATLNASTSSGKPWQILGNQVMLARVTSPNYVEELPFYVRQVAKRDEFIWEFLKRTRFRIPANLDSWDGFPADRTRLYTAARTASANLVAFTGDTHCHWASRLTSDDGAPVGVEFATSSVTSPSAYELLKAPGLHAGRLVERANPEVEMMEPYRRGYIRARFTADRVAADFITVDTVTSPAFTAKIAHQFTARPAAAGGVTDFTRL